MIRVRPRERFLDPHPPPSYQFCTWPFFSSKLVYIFRVRLGPLAWDPCTKLIGGEGGSKNRSLGWSRCQCRTIIISLFLVTTVITLNQLTNIILGATDSAADIPQLSEMESDLQTDQSVHGSEVIDWLINWSKKLKNLNRQFYRFTENVVLIFRLVFLVHKGTFALFVWYKNWCDVRA